MSIFLICDDFKIILALIYNKFEKIGNGFQQKNLSILVYLKNKKSCKPREKEFQK